MDWGGAKRQKNEFNCRQQLDKKLIFEYYGCKFGFGRDQGDMEEIKWESFHIHWGGTSVTLEAITLKIGLYYNLLSTELSFTGQL